jgi:hypothetical protein
MIGFVETSSQDRRNRGAMWKENDMARYIDADILIQAFQEEFNKDGAKADDMAMRGIADASVKYSHGQFCYLNAIERVKDAPAADVVEVVRCKDCRHSTINGGDCNSIIVHYVRNEITELNEEAYSRLDYCSYGKRKEQT